MPQATHKEIHDNNQIIDSNHLPKKCVILTRDGTGLNLAIDFKYRWSFITFSDGEILFNKFSSKFLGI